MKSFDYFKLAGINLKRNDKLFLKNIVWIAISISLLLISYITTSSMNNMLNKSIKYNIAFRTIYIENSENKEHQLFIEELEKIEHIDKIVEQENYKVNVDIVNIDNSEDRGKINLIGTDRKITPQIIKGREINSNEINECIVPKKFYTGDITQKIDNNKIINGELLLNKEIEIVYYTYDYTKEIPVPKEEHIEKLKVVGIYDTDDNMGDYNECYVDFKTVRQINDIILEGLNYNNTSNPLVAIIDNSENIDIVMQELDNLNYETFLYTTPNYTLINIIDWTGKIIAFSIMILVVLNIIINSIKNSQDRKKEYGLLKAIGYKKSDIWKIILVESLTLGILSFMLACIITLIVLGILLEIQKNSILEIQKIKISITYMSFIICFAIAISVPSIGNILSSISVVNKSVVSNSQE